MAKVLPFRALRYDLEKAGDLKSLLSPPYDIVSPEEQRRLEERNPFNVIRLELPQGEDRYQKAGLLLEDWEKSGILREDGQDCFYLYEEEFAYRNEVCRVSGLIGRVALEDFSKGVILPHEETLSKAKEDRLNLMRETFCNFSPIYSLYYDPEKAVASILEAVMNEEPALECTTDDGVIHRLWSLEDGPRAQAIVRAFRDKKLYIADGHHRYETALKFKEEVRFSNCPQETREAASYCMMLLTDMEHPGLKVFPTHRMVHGIADFEPTVVLSVASNFFEVTKMKAPATLERELNLRENTVAFYCGGDYYFLLKRKDSVDVHTVLPDRSEAYCNLDVTALHTLLLEPALGISQEKLAAQTNLTYTRDMKEAIDGVQTGQFQCAFFLNPTKVTEIRDVALAGEKMPQKSTYFYPKPVTGMVVNKIGEKQ